MSSPLTVASSACRAILRRCFGDSWLSPSCNSGVLMASRYIFTGLTLRDPIPVPLGVPIPSRGQWAVRRRVTSRGRCRGGPCAWLTMAPFGVGGLCPCPLPAPPRAPCVPGGEELPLWSADAWRSNGLQHGRFHTWTRLLGLAGAQAGPCCPPETPQGLSQRSQGHVWGQAAPPESPRGSPGPHRAPWKAL